MKHPAASLLCALALALGGVGPSAHAGEIYKYVEADGTIVYTNVKPQGVKKAQTLKGSFKPAPRPTDAPASTRLVRVSREQYDELIHSAATRYRIPEALVWAVMHAESNFDPHAVSPVGASGLMQLMPATASEMYVKDIFDVKENIEGGTRYLRVLANMFDGDMVKMVAAYNAGPDAVKKYGGKVPPYAETRAYVAKVIKLYFQYKKQRAEDGAN
ncbi:MAG: lytic transglycosylase domain-containing protein [Myxococcaceae bacterium]|nr:lytic transglycosylase domain-containing protein [Myxococcaceae bacterium]